MCRAGEALIQVAEVVHCSKDHASQDMLAVHIHGSQEAAAAVAVGVEVGRDSAWVCCREVVAVGDFHRKVAENMQAWGAVGRVGRGEGFEHVMSSEVGYLGRLGVEDWTVEVDEIAQQEGMSR